MRRLRADLLQISQAQFAREVGISLPLVKKLEAGETPLSDFVRQSVRAAYAAELTSDGVFDLSGKPYERELGGLLREVGQSRVLGDMLLEGQKKDLELLRRAAEAKNSLHLLTSRYHSAIRRIADDLQLTEVMERMQKDTATVSAGEIRAWERTAPLRRKHDLLCRRIERLAMLLGKKRQLSKLRKQAAKLAREIEERKRRSNVAGRRKLLYHWIGGKPVIIPPSAPNSHRYPASHPQREFCHWWDDYVKHLGDLCNPPDAGEE